MVSKEECLARWHAAAHKRTAVAQQIMSGKRKMNTSWPMWVQYDIRAEITALKTDRSQSKAAAKQKRERHEADLFD